MTTTVNPNVGIPLTLAAQRMPMAMCMCIRKPTVGGKAET